nr:hypothetical protein [Luteitalea pratensis]
MLLMVLYHWLNYFIGLDWPGYPYLRFLTPSFLFITGFIVGRVYLARYAGSPWQLAGRSWQRGVKLLTLFTVLNFVDTASALGSIDPDILKWAWPSERLEAVFLHGGGGAAFSILIPIAYFLFAVPLIWWSVRVAGVPLWLLASAMVALAITRALSGYGNAQFEFISVGVAGAGLGAARRFKLEFLASHVALLLVLYGLHLAAIAVWNTPFEVQVVTTYLNVSFLYACASRLNPRLILKQGVVELGEYSLFAYVVQIVALQVLRRGMPAPPGVGGKALALAVAILLTCAAVRLMARIRSRSRPVDWWYRTVFA